MMKTVLITGAGSGIGEHLALAFAKAGFAVAVTDLNFSAAERVATRIQIEEQGIAMPIALDVMEEGQVVSAFRAVMEAWGRLDCLINNAGIQIIKPLVELDLATWEKMMAIHLTAAFLCTREAFKIMMTHKSGTIIYIGSIHSKLASVCKVPYVTAKHGLLGLSRTVAKEGAAYNIRSHVICPGFVRTPLVEKQIPEQAKTLGIGEEEVVKKVMLGETVDGEFTTVEEISAMALFLASYPNLGLTGQSFMLTHGWNME